MALTSTSTPSGSNSENKGACENVSDSLKPAVVTENFSDPEIKVLFETLKQFIVPGHPTLWLSQQQDIDAFDFVSGLGSGVWAGWVVHDGKTHTNSKGVDVVTSADLNLEGVAMGDVPANIRATVGVNASSISVSNLPASPITIAIPDHSHSITIPDHSHSVTDNGHSHTITDPGHSHTGDLENATGRMKFSSKYYTKTDPNESGNNHRALAPLDGGHYELPDDTEAVGHDYDVRVTDLDLDAGIVVPNSNTGVTLGSSNTGVGIGSSSLSATVGNTNLSGSASLGGAGTPLPVVQKSVKGVFVIRIETP